MPRIRSVHPDLHRDKTLASISATAERTFVRLWCHLDDEGRGEDDPDLLKADLYPRHRDVGPDQIEADLVELEAAGLIIRYTVDGDPYLCCKPDTWSNYQRPQKKQESKLPGPDQADEPPATKPVRDRSYTGTRPLPPVGEGRGEGVGVGEEHPSSTDVDREEDDRFEEFWNTYPARNGKKLHKAKAKQQWKSRVRTDERDAAIQGATHYRLAYENGLPGVGAMDAFRWLRDRCWPDWQEPSEPDQRKTANGTDTAPPRARLPDIGSPEWEAREAEKRQLEERILGGAA